MGDRESRASRRPRARVALAAAVAAAAVALVGLGALRQVDSGFARRHLALDLGQPAVWAVEPAAVAPGTAGRLLWPGTRPLEARFGPVEAGDLLKLKVRADRAGVTVRVLLDGQEVVAGEAPTDWRQFEIEMPRPGSVLRLEQPARPTAPVHVSRLSLTNVRGFAELGPLAVYVRAAKAAASGRPGGLGRALLAATALALLVVVVAWRRRTGAGDLPAALWAGAVELAPAAGLALAAAAAGVRSGHRLVYPASTLLLLVAGPALAVEGWRCRAALAAALRRLGPWLEGVGGRLGLDRVSAGAAAAGAGLAAPHLRRAAAAHLVLVAVLGALLATVVVRDFGGPMVGEGDISQWVFQGHYFGSNLSFTPLPRLDLANDQLFYPYGGSNVFQPWVLEMHLFTSLADWLLGRGPWVQLYFLLAVLVTAVGAFLLLVRDHGFFRASLVAVAVSFCNYYAISKYAAHVGLSCCHWMTLNLLADALLVRRLALGRPWSARLLALRGLLAVLILGQDLSVVAGIALTSLCVSALVAAGVTAARAGGRPRALRATVRRGAGALRASAAEHPAQVAALVAATLLVALLWVPLVLQIAAASRAFDFTGVSTGEWWANPARMLIPIFPGLNPDTAKQLFDDHREAWFDADPGWFFVLWGVAGLLWGRRRWREWLPFALLLVAFLSFHPTHFPLLRALPWFSFARVSGRFTLAYPALLCILGLCLPPALLRGRRAVAAAVVACGLLLVETVTACHVDLAKPRRFYPTGGGFAEVMAAARRAPGEAVLDWPFCVASGNGVGGSKLGRYYGRQSGSSVLRAFHGKKIVAKYFGRLHPTQIEPYLEAGWDRMFFPDDESGFRAQRQHRDFRPTEWSFLERFFVLNDFCGLILYTDLLPQATVEGFHSRFGAPVAVAEGTPFGRLEFIPKRAEWREEVDREAGRSLRLPFVAPPRPLQRVKMDHRSASEYLIRGWGSYQRKIRSSEGPFAELGFALDQVEPLELEMKATTYQRQRVRVLLNGTLVDELLHDGHDYVLFTVALPAALLRPSNVIRFELPDAHSPQSVGESRDTRVLGITVEWLQLSAVE